MGRIYDLEPSGNSAKNVKKKKKRKKAPSYVSEANTIFNLVVIADPTKQPASKHSEVSTIRSAKVASYIDIDKSIKILSNFSTKKQVSTDILKELVKYYSFKGLYDLGIEIFKKIEKSYLGDEDTLYILADLYTANNDIDNAKECMNKILREDPKNLSALFQLAFIVSQDDLKEAYDIAVGLKEQALTNPELYSEILQETNDLLTLIYNDLGDYDSIIEIVDEAGDYKSDNPYVNITIGSAYNSIEQYDQALRYYERAKELSKFEFLQIKAGDYQSEEYAAFSPVESAELTSLYIKLEKFDEAKTCIDEMINTIDEVVEWDLYDKLINVIKLYIDDNKSVEPEMFINSLLEKTKIAKKTMLFSELERLKRDINKENLMIV